MRKFGALVVCILLTLSPLIGRGAPEEQPVPEPIGFVSDTERTFTIGMLESEDQLLLDPVRATDTNSLLVLDGLFEGLFSFHPETGDPIPALAEKVAVSDDGLTWTFTLRENSRFSNGDPITAESVVDSWLWLLGQSQSGEGKSYLSSMMDSIRGVPKFRTGETDTPPEGIVLIDSHTIELRLLTPAPYLPSLLSTLPFSVIHHSLRNGETISPAEIISSGPFHIVSLSDSSILLEKHQWYVQHQAVPSDYIDFRIMSQAQITEAYRNREIHWSLAFISQDALINPQDLRIAPEYSTGFFYFSAESGPYADPSVRKAMSLLIPWDEIRNTSGHLFPTAQLLPGHVEPGSSPLTDPEDPVSEAFALLLAAGYPYGAGLPPLHMAVHRGSQVEESAQRIADAWSRHLGITVVLDVVPLGMYARYPELSPYDFSFITWIGDFRDPFTFLHLWSSDSGYNLGKFRDSTYDDLLVGSMRVAQSSEKRTELARIAEEYLLEQALVFPLFHGFSINIIQSDAVTGWYDNILNIHPVKHLGIK